MSLHFSSDNLHEIHQVLIAELLDSPDCTSAPRGKPIRECINASFTLTNPRNRLILSPARNVNYGFGVGELCWYVRGDTDLETMLYYNRRMAQFSDDGKTINSAYGYRMFKKRWLGESPCEDRDQLDNCISELVKDPDSRRAVMHINQPYDLNKAVQWGSKDVPCTLSLQLLIRDRKLHMNVTMRSNDIVWGLPYDAFSFTCLQETFLYQLQGAGVPVDALGTYNHTAGSLHLYDTHFEMAGVITKEPWQIPAPMKPFTLDQLRRLSEELEPQIRTSWEGWRAGFPLKEGECDDGTLEWMTRKLCDHKQKRLTEESKESSDKSP